MVARTDPDEQESVVLLPHLDALASSGVLFTASPMHGHVNTVLPLAQAAQRAGHEVVLPTGTDMTSHAERHGLPAWPIGPAHAEAGGRGLSVDCFTYAAEKCAVGLAPRTGRVAARSRRARRHRARAGPIAAAATGARSVVHGLGPMYPLRIFDALTATADRVGARRGVPSVAVEGVRQVGRVQ